MVKKYLSVKKGLMKASNKSHSSKRLLSKSHNAVLASAHSHNETKRHDYCLGCKCKVDIINIKQNNIKRQNGVVRPCITGECVKGHKWVRFVKKSNTLTKSMKGGAHARASSIRSSSTSRSNQGQHKKNYATIEDFINAQTHGINQSQQIPGTHTLFDRGDSTNFAGALADIKTGKKQKHWFWYILPSNLPTISRTAEFFKIDQSGQTISIYQYIGNESLFKNYVIIINAIHDTLKEKNKQSLIIMLGAIDYDKLCSSLKMFRDVVIAKLYTLPPADVRDSIKNINYISDICEGKV